MRTVTVLVLLVFAVVWLDVSPALAQVVAEGGQFQVNTYTTDDQRRPAVGIADDGSFVVAWESSEFTDLPTGGTIFQRFDSAGVSIGDDVAIQASAGSDWPRLGVSPAGSFVVSWIAPFFDTPTAQLFDASGIAVGDAFEISQDEAVEMALDMGSGGDFVVAWSLNPSTGPPLELGSIGIVKAQRYTSDGTTMGADFEVARDQVIIGGQEIGVAADGSFLVVWTGGEAVGDDTSNTSVQGRFYDSAGQTVGDAFQINSFTTGFQRAPTLDVDGAGRFVVVWESDDGVDERICGQRFEGGSPLGDEFLVFDGGGDQSRPQVRVTPDDGFVVTWVDGDSETGGVRALRFDASGVSDGVPLQVNELGSAGTFDPGLAVGAFGEVVVVWESTLSPGDDDDRDSVQARRLLVPCDTGACLAVFVDGFESGDTSGWSVSSP